MQVPSRRLSPGIARLKRAIETLRHHHVAHPDGPTTKIFILTRRGSASHIFRYTFSNGFKRLVIARSAQISQIGLGKRLVATFQFFREWDVLNAAFFVVRKRCIGNGLERFRTTGTKVKDAGNPVFQNHRFTAATSPT